MLVSVTLAFWEQNGVASVRILRKILEDRKLTGMGLSNFYSVVYIIPALMSPRSYLS